MVNKAFISPKFMQKKTKKTEFLPSSCLLTVRFRSGIRYARVQTFFAGSVCTQCKRLYSIHRNKRS